MFSTLIVIAALGQNPYGQLSDNYYIPPGELVNNRPGNVVQFLFGAPQERLQWYQVPNGLRLEYQRRIGLFGLRHDHLSTTIPIEEPVVVQPVPSNIVQPQAQTYRYRYRRYRPHTYGYHIYITP